MPPVVFHCFKLTVAVKSNFHTKDDSQETYHCVERPTAKITKRRVLADSRSVEGHQWAAVVVDCVARLADT